MEGLVSSEDLFCEECASASVTSSNTQSPGGAQVAAESAATTQRLQSWLERGERQMGPSLGV